MPLLLEHVPISLIIGLTSWAFSGDKSAILYALMGGLLVDLDHIYDLLHSKPRLDEIVSLISSGKYFRINNKVYVPCHSYEFVLVIIGYAYFFNNLMVCVFGISYLCHLIQDQITYRVKPLGYFLINRIVNKFSLEGFCKKQCL